MLRNCLLAFFMLCAVVLIGCSKTETMNNENKTAAANSTKPATATTNTAAKEAAREKIGVPECDDFIAKYEACVSGKVPEMARAQYQTALKQWRDSWRKLAENPNTKGTLASACKQAAQQQAAALKTYGCAF